MSKGVILITVSDDSEDEISSAFNEDRIPNPHRTGGWFVLKDSAIRRMVKPAKVAELIIKHRWSFIPDAVAKMVGLTDAPPTE